MGTNKSGYYKAGKFWKWDSGFLLQLEWLFWCVGLYIKAKEKWTASVLGTMAIELPCFCQARTMDGRKTNMKITKAYLASRGWKEKSGIMVRFSNPRIGWKEDGTLIIGYREYPEKVKTVGFLNDILMSTYSDECQGGICQLKFACQRYSDYLRSRSPYPMTPREKDCPMFKPNPYYGN